MTAVLPGRRAAGRQAGFQAIQLVGLLGKPAFEPFQVMPHPRNFFGQQHQADQDKNPALNHGQKATNDTKKQKKNTEDDHHDTTEVPDHGGILADRSRQ
jgi:hypothetical protein